MKIVIIGAGVVGRNICKHLLLEKYDITVIENRKEVVDEILNTLDVQAILGNGMLASVQKQADVSKADIVICVTESDEINILSALVAKSLGAKKTIARVRSTEYNTQFDFMREKLGIDLFINPEREAAKEIAELLRFPYAVHTDYFAGGRISSVTIEVPEDCNLVGLKLSDLKDVFDVNIVVYAIDRNGEFIIPKMDFTIMDKDKISIIAKADVLKSFSKKIGMVKTKTKNAMILGGSRIAFYLAETLLENKISVKIIEKNKDVCDEISEHLAGVSLVLADGSDYHVLEEQGVENIDAFITLTGIDEENMVVSLYAKSKGVENVITKINNSDLKEIAENVDLKKCISTKNGTTSQIVKFARQFEAEMEEDNPILTLSKIIEGKGEVIEFDITENENFAGKQIFELPLIKDTLIACIVRNKEIIIPEPNEVLENDDKIVVVTKATQIGTLDEILRV